MEEENERYVACLRKILRDLIPFCSNRDPGYCNRKASLCQYMTRVKIDKLNPYVCATCIRIARLAAQVKAQRSPNFIISPMMN